MQTFVIIIVLLKLELKLLGRRRSFRIQIKVWDWTLKLWTWAFSVFGYCILHSSDASPSVRCPVFVARVLKAGVGTVHFVLSFVKAAREDGGRETPWVFSGHENTVNKAFQYMCSFNL